MPNRYATAARNFDPMALAGVSAKARDAVSAALDAMTAWRNEAAENSEKNSKKVIDKMAAAAEALGWPEQIVNAARSQMQSVAEAQIKTMDQMMDAWEEQLRSSDPTTVMPSAMLSKVGTLPGLGTAANWPGAINPMGFWIQFTDQWQRSWADAMTNWSKAAGGRH